MIPAPKYHSDSRAMEAFGEVKKEPVAAAVHRNLLAGKEGGRLVKRKRSPSESEQGHKKSHSVSGVNSASRAPPKTKSAKENGAVNSTVGKRKRPIVAADVDSEMDSEHVMNAAQALFELFGRAGTSQKEALEKKSSGAGGVQWAAKKSRSSRSKKADDCPCKPSSSSSTSATVTDVPEVLDSSTSHNHQVAVSQARPVGVETVNLEDESEVDADADAKSTDMSPCGLDFDRQRLMSQSSVESTLLDSRAESPSSPLRILKPDADLIPKLEEEIMLQFGFQKHPPVRPVTKPSTLRKPKVEEKSSVQLAELKEVKIALKQVQRRKPRASNSKGQLPLLQGDVLDVPIAPSAPVLKECIEENKFQVPVTLNLFEPVKLESGIVKLESGIVKLEGRELYQTGSSTQGRLRSTLSEAEKEARRLRRVQANRESARQTIRRKQVLCEELARKAGELQAEKDSLSQSIEAKNKEIRSHQEINRHLKEQILSQAASAAETPLPSSKASDLESTVPATAPIHGVSVYPYWWAFALAQSVAAASQSSAAPQMVGEPGAAAAPALPPDFNTVFAATVATFNSGAGMNPNMWMGMMGNMANKSQIPGMVPALDQHQQQPSLFHSAPRPAGTVEATPQQLPATSMAQQTPQVSGRSLITLNVHPFPSGCPSSSPMKGSTTNLDPCSPAMSRLQPNGKILAGMSSVPSSRVKFQVTNLPNGGAPAPLMRSTSGMSQMTQMHVNGDSMASTSTTLSLGLGSGSHQSLQSHHAVPIEQQQQLQQIRKPANLRFFPSIVNGVQGFLGPRLGGYQSEAAALATEARRRRRELKRTKSLQSQLQQEKKLASVKSL